MTSLSNSQFVVNKTGALFFGIMFIICTTAHAVMILWRRSWFMFWFLVGCIIELVGYLQLHSGTSSQSVCIIIASVFLAASVYLSFSTSLEHFQAKDLCSLNISFFALFFFIGDVICLGLQIAGIILQFMNGKESLGKAIVIVSFVLQIVLFCFFSLNVFIVHRRLRHRRPKVIVDSIFQWPSFFILIYVISLLFLIRNVFRLVEYSQGFGYIFYHAIFTYIFDGAPMLLVALLLICFHPTFWMDSTLKKRKKEMRKNEKARHKEERAIQKKMRRKTSKFQEQSQQGENPFEDHSLEDREKESIS